MKMLCDQMLGGLGKWLRAAGYDTVIADRNMHDTALLTCARDQARVLLTCDRQLKTERASEDPTVVLMRSNRPDLAAHEAASALGIDWLHRPFTRCLTDNAMLLPATCAQVAQMPARSRALSGPFRACPDCGRVYWPGSHVRRMMRRLQDWRDRAAADQAALTNRG